MTKDIGYGMTSHQKSSAPAGFFLEEWIIRLLRTKSSEKEELSVSSFRFYRLMETGTLLGVGGGFKNFLSEGSLSRPWRQQRTQHSMRLHQRFRQIPEAHMTRFECANEFSNSRDVFIGVSSPLKFVEKVDSDHEINSRVCEQRRRVSRYREFKFFFDWRIARSLNAGDARTEIQSGRELLLLTVTLTPSCEASLYGISVTESSHGNSSLQIWNNSPKSIQTQPVVGVSLTQTVLITRSTGADIGCRATSRSTSVMAVSH